MMAYEGKGISMRGDGKSTRGSKKIGKRVRKMSIVLKLEFSNNSFLKNVVECNK